MRPNPSLSTLPPCRAAVRAARRSSLALLLAASAAGSLGCSSFILGKAADGLSSGTGGSFARDDDPKLVGDAIPIALKTMESLADQLPEHAGLRLSLASGFTQYGYAFVQADADELDEKEPARAAEMRHRAKRLYVRARDYGLAGLQIRRGITIEELRKSDEARAAALGKAGKDDVPMLYWTLVPWAAAIAAEKRDLALVGDLPIIAAMLDRALALDPNWQEGTLQEFSLAFDSARAGGTTQEAAKAHYELALELSHGNRLSVKVSWAENAAVAAQDKEAFEKLLHEVLAFDTDALAVRDLRLANLIAQRRAKFLLAHEDDLIAGRVQLRDAVAAAGASQVSVADARFAPLPAGAIR